MEASTRLLHPPVVERVGDAGQPLLAQRGRPLLERLLERLGHGAALLVEVHRARGGARRPAARAAGSPCPPSAPPWPGPSSRPGAPTGSSSSAMARSASAATGGLPGGLGRGVLRLDGLADGLQPAAQQLLGHRDLLGPQRRQHGVAVHRRRRHDRALAAGGTPVALAGTATARADRRSAAARAPVDRRRARRAAPLAVGTAGCRRRHRAVTRPPLAVVTVRVAACPSPGPG